MPASSTAKSPACEDGKRSATKSSNVPVKPGSLQPFQVAIARVTLVWKRRTCERSDSSRSTLTRNAPVLPFSVVGRVDRDLDVGPLALFEVADRVVAALGLAEQHAVVARLAVVAAVVDVRVEAVLVDARVRRQAVEHAQPHLLGRAVGARHVRPAGRRRRRRRGERVVAGETGRVVELERERRREGRRVLGRDVVRRHPATRAEVAEVERRPVDRAAAAARPLDLGDALAGPFGRLRERLGLQHAVVERRRAARAEGLRAAGAR